jgi:outer membrane receptor for ferrienterochelin and colicin
MAINYMHGQTVINGKIYDKENQEPLVGANIQLVSDLNIGTITNSSGYFELKTSETNPSILISMMGYTSREVKYQGKSLLIDMTGNAQELQAIVVTGSREAALRTQLPMAISRLSAKLIDESKITSVVEVINKTPGVLMQNLNNEQHGMSIRQPMGTSAYYLYMEDGLPIRPLGIFNHNALLEINQFAISSIEVVKGPVSSIYGPEAVGGAINFISQRPTAVPTAKIHPPPNLPSKGSGAAHNLIKLAQ